MEKINAETRQFELRTQRKQALSDVEYSYQTLRNLMQVEQNFEIINQELPMLAYDTLLNSGQMKSNLGVTYYNELSMAAETQIKVEKSKLWPELRAEYFLGRGQGENAASYNGYQFGLGIPLLGGAQRGRVQASRIEMAIREPDIESYQIGLQSRYQQLYALLRKYQEAVTYYQNRGLDMAEEIVEMAEKSYLSGETGYLQYIQSLESARQINLNYLKNLNQYNQTVLEIKYLVQL